MCTTHRTCHNNGLVQDCRISSALYHWYDEMYLHLMIKCICISYHNITLRCSQAIEIFPCGRQRPTHRTWHNNGLVQDCRISSALYHWYDEMYLHLMIKCICISYHYITLRWHRLLKSFLVGDKDPFILHIWYHGCCWPSYARSQGIRSHSIDLVIPENSHSITTWIKI